MVPPGRLAYGRVDTGRFLSQAVVALNVLPRPPDVVIVTGDLVDSGNSLEYTTFLEIMTGVAVPLLPVVGNHDDRKSLAQAFGLRSRFNVQPRFVQYAIEDFAVRILVVDTVTQNSDEPSLCEDRLAWIESRLAEDTRPTLIAMHHPPFIGGVAWMKPTVTNWAAQLAGIVARHPSIVRITCGHVHRAMTVMWAGICTMTAPSTAHQVFPDLTCAAPPRLNLEAPGFLMHEWTGEQMMSYGITIPGLADTIVL